MMKNFLVIVSVLMLGACSDPYEVKVPDFEVWTDQEVYTVGEVVRFHISGNVDMIDFYSGTVGNDYAYRNRERFFELIPTVSFRASKAVGDNEDCASLLVTTEFDGNYDFDNVKSTNWIDISERFDIPPIRGTSAFFYDAGEASIADLIEEGRLVEGNPIYFAWYCKTEPESLTTRFQVADFNLNGVDVENPNASDIVASQVQMGFQWVLDNATLSQPSSLPSMTAPLIYWNGILNNKSTNTTANQQHSGLGKLKEGYAVSLPIALGKEMNMGTDSPIPIKSVQTENMTGYSYEFASAGEYEVTFVGYNVNMNGRKDVVKTIRVTIED